MRIVLEISYIGTNYKGWQVQQDLPTVQKTLQDALYELTKERIKVYASGRTDTGVHALKQVVHFDCDYPINPEKYAFALNVKLPNDIRVIKSYEVGANFNARFDVQRKTYVYKFYTSKIELPFDRERAYQLPFSANHSKMKKCADLFVGTHDFTSFCKVNKEEKDRVRTIYYCKINNTSDIHYEIEICGNGFLHNMVRIIAGTIIDVGLGKIELDTVKTLLSKKTIGRNESGRTLPPYALYLKNVEY